MLLPRARLPARGRCSTTSRCSAGRWATTARCSPSQEMVDGVHVSIGSARNPARFDLKKCEAINAVHMRDAGTRTTWPSGSLPFLQQAGMLADPSRPSEQRRAAAGGGPARAGAHDRARRRRRDARLPVRRPTTASSRTPRPRRRRSATDAAAPCWTRRCAALRRPRGLDHAATSRTALRRRSGRRARAQAARRRSRRCGWRSPGARVSPPLFESMELLGRERTLARLAALRRRGSPAERFRSAFGRIG